ncbi:MAG: NAD(P)H-dependent oxidoreductase [Pseudomonadales bacterium]|nr:NAD(P)H-dependent oxidoreductase [Pseudomonadales bacterium]
MKSTIILFASARRHGNTGKLADRIATALNAPVIDLGQRRISGFDYSHGNRHDDFEPLMEAVLTYRQLVFASPIYWYAVAPAMKIFLDRLTDYLDLPDLCDKGRLLRSKTGFVICTSNLERADGSFMDAFKKTFAYLGMRYGGAIHADCSQGFPGKSLEHDIRAFIQLFKHDRDNRNVIPAAR